MDEQKKSFNKKLIGITALVFLFVAVVLVWYFFYAKPATAPSLDGTASPLFSSEIKPGSLFLLNDENGSNETDTPQSQTEVTNTPNDPLIQVWNKPATGQSFVDLQVLKEETSTSTKGTSTVSITRTIRATSTALLFIDRATGYVYAYSLESRKVFQMTNTLVPGVYDAYIFNNGRRIIMRYIDKEKDTVTAIIAKLPQANEKSATEPLQEVKYLNGEVGSVAVSSFDGSASYTVVTKSGSSIYTVKDKEPTLLTSSPFREWVLGYGGSRLYATPRASSYIEGSTFSLPSFYAEVIGRTGLVTTPGPNGVLFSSMLSSKGLLTFFSKESKMVLTETKTIASKCGWGSGLFLVCGVPKIPYKSGENLPDDWYQGSVHFKDDIYQVDPLTGNEIPIYQFTSDDGTMDILSLSVNTSNTLITYINKKDNTLWLLNRDYISTPPEE
jgi:hypothetical protein